MPRPPRSPASKRAKSQGPSWLRFALAEALTWSTAVLGGLGVACAALFLRAHHDLVAWLEDPPEDRPGVIWSAPVEVEAGLPATVPELVGDLLSAGYVKVGSVTGPGEFAVDGSTVHLWTARWSGPGVDVPEQRGEIVIRGDRIARTDPRPGLLLRPTVLATVGDPEGRREDVEIASLSPWVEPAVLAMEDQRFREHIGVDAPGILRALRHNMSDAPGLQGGSTLTQQLAKNLFLGSERTLQRKVREVFFSAAMELELSKDEILALYLREVYLGQAGGVPLHGVEQAARAWFATDPSRLSLAESATLAGVIAAPNRYSPLRHPERARERRDQCLDAMVATGALTHEQAAEAKAEELVIDGALPGAVRRAPWAVDVAIDQVEDALGAGVLSTSGLHVHTNIQPLLQRAAEASVADGMAELDRGFPKARGAQAALVAVRVADGAVLAVVGSRDYLESPYNRAFSARRQVGSAVKGLTLLAAFDENPGMTPIDRVSDAPVSIEQRGARPWTPRNYDGGYWGELTLRQAIEASRNVPAVLLAERVGFGDLQAFFQRAGLAEAHPYPSIALGAFGTNAWEMAGAYTAFPGGGTVHDPWLVRAVTDPDGRQIVAFAPSARPLATARAAALSTSILEGVMTDGTGARAARYGVRGPVGGKTGTTNSYRDAWLVGFTPELSVAVWVGDDRKSGLGLSGSRAALPTWSRFVARSGTMGEGAFPAPAGVVHAQVCTHSLQVAAESCPSTYDEVFAAGTVPTATCGLHGFPPPLWPGLWELLTGGGRPPEAIGGPEVRELPAPIGRPEARELPEPDRYGRDRYDAWREQVRPASRERDDD